MGASVFPFLSKDSLPPNTTLQLQFGFSKGHKLTTQDMLLCVLAEAFAALNLRTMHRAHLLYIASFC